MRVENLNSRTSRNDGRKRTSIVGAGKPVKFKRAKQGRGSHRSVTMSLREAKSNYMKHINDLERSRFAVRSFPRLLFA